MSSTILNLTSSLLTFSCLLLLHSQTTSCLTCKPLSVESTPETEEFADNGFEYLIKYGYFACSNTNGTKCLHGPDRTKRAIKDFQAFAGINQTGLLDVQTQELMETPRCGVRDPIGHGYSARRRKRYVLQGSRWSVKELTYRITKYPSTGRLSKSEVDTQIKLAFQMWQDVSGLTFTRKKTGSVHIEIRFEGYEHGDGDPFDGPGGTLAHAYFPQYGGDMHIDDGEYWTIDSYRGTNLLQTVVHEIGHSLGLSHSDVHASIMAPFYKGWEPNLKLHADDVKAIQALYGDRKEKPSFSTTTRRPGVTQGPGGGSLPRPPNPSGGGDLCANPSIDTILRTEDGNTYVFQGGDYWKLTDDSVAPGYPRRISSDWSGLPDNIDGAFTWPESGNSYIFKGSQYWKFKNQKGSSNYPKDINEGFPNIPSDIDAVFVWSGNGKVFFFKGTKYWKFDPERTPHVRLDRYPRSISVWGLPDNMEGALQWNNGYTYFFKDGEYYRYNDRKFRIDSASPRFPRPTSVWWFGCENSQNVFFPQGVVREEVVVVVVGDNGEEEETGEDEFGEDDFAEVGDEQLDIETDDY